MAKSRVWDKLGPDRYRHLPSGLEIVREMGGDLKPMWRIQGAVGLVHFSTRRDAGEHIARHGLRAEASDPRD